MTPPPLHCAHRDGVDLRTLRLDHRHGHNALHYLTHSYISRKMAPHSTLSDMRFIDMLTLLCQLGIDINDGSAVTKQTALHIAVTKPKFSELVKVGLHSS